MIKVCKNCKELERIIEHLNKKQHEFVIENCLDQCEICRDKYFLIKNEKLIIADNIEDLLKKL
ncbi:DUF1450 domain-containing protein [Thermosipho ferrireducens]|uniref:DUF1450 domain-containing protein n=1 Tax=Thermosipho ferrireducens TaxID=2571116 RepID=A0ABX7S593_9BACT|nr:DUF1450 domain-containing protein [Thermosipho ferrireducens]QTA37684.1 DUF1450 domain-containing protein [Thermosipho ferrireducens]